MTTLINQILQDDDGRPIVYDVYYNPTHKPKPIVIFCHGYKGFKDWGVWHIVAEAFAKAGFFFLKFNFSHNGGTIEQPIDFPDLEAFAQNNYTKELDDLDRMIDYIATTKRFHDEAKVSEIALVGHSRGGGIVLIKAEENPMVKKVVTWAAVSDFKARFKMNSDSFEHWRQTGRMYVENGRTKQQMPHDWQFFENFMAHEQRLTIRRAVAELDKPCLFIHGEKDTTVGIAEAKNLERWNAHAELFIIKEGDHVFGASHPWDQPILPAPLKKVVRKTVEFLNAKF